MHIFVSLCGYVNMSADVSGSQKRAFHPLALELQAAVTCLLMGPGKQTLQEKSCKLLSSELSLQPQELGFTSQLEDGLLVIYDSKDET